MTTLLKQKTSKKIKLSLKKALKEIWDVKQATKMRQLLPFAGCFALFATAKIVSVCLFVYRLVDAIRFAPYSKGHCFGESVCSLWGVASWCPFMVLSSLASFQVLKRLTRQRLPVLCLSPFINLNVW